MSKISIPELVSHIRTIFRFRPDQFYLQATAGNQVLVGLRDPNAATRARPFQMFQSSDTKIRVLISTVNGANPAFPTADAPFSPGDSPPCIFTTATDTGFLYSHIEIDGTGTVITNELAFGSSVPSDDATNFYYQIGSWLRDGTSHKITNIANDAFGPITAQICQILNSDPVAFLVNFFAQS
jgi:hypothetical protein